MKIVFLCNQFPYPPISGMRRKILIFTKYLKKNNNKIYLFSLTPPQREFENRIFEEIVIAKRVNFIEKFKSLIKGFFKKPIQISIYNNSKNIKFFKEYVKSIKPDLIFIDYIRSGDYGLGLKLPKIINYDDPQSLKYKRMEEFLNEIENPFGEGIDFLPKLLRKIFLFKFFKKIILKYEIYTLKRYEREISKHYNLVLTNSKEDALYLKKNKVKNIGFFPPLIDKEFYNFEVQNKKDIITFIGKMDYPPNPYAVLYFIKEILPEIEKNYSGQFKFQVIGAKTPEWMFKLSNEKIKIVGEVEDIRPYLGESKVFVAPLKFGSGIKVKILEAMALGVPVVTTSVGIQGMNVKNGVHLFVEDEIEEFAKKIIILLKDENLRNEISKNAKDYVFKNFDAENYVKEMEKCFKNLCKYKVL
jgi:glycosyltransferase involved in cell wall biosynthesis